MRQALGIAVLVGLAVASTACGKKSDAAAAPPADTASAAPPTVASAAAPPPPAVDAAIPDAAPPDQPEAAPAPPPSPAMAAAHPAYLHALTDLRIARVNLIRRGGDRAQHWDEHVAIRAIDRAIHEINMAAISDGKNLDDRQPSDITVDFGGRLHRALAALQAAHADVAKQEDNAAVKGLRDRAIRNIDEAIALTQDGIADWGRPMTVVGPRPPPPPPPMRPAPPRPH